MMLATVRRVNVGDVTRFFGQVVEIENVNYGPGHDEMGSALWLAICDWEWMDIPYNAMNTNWRRYMYD